MLGVETVDVSCLARLVELYGVPVVELKSAPVVELKGVSCRSLS